MTTTTPNTINRDPFHTMYLTDTHRSKFLATIAACERFIAKHGDSDLPHLREHLDFCQKHRAELLELLETS